MSRAWKLGDNVATDEILPFQYMTLTEPSELGRHVLENVKPGFAQSLAAGDVIVAGGNFGYGSSREQAPLSLKGAGIGAVVAATFARIFFRNCINIGLPAIVCPEASREVHDGDDLVVDIAGGVIRNNTSGASYAFIPFSESVMEYLRDGGLVNTVNKHRSG